MTKEEEKTTEEDKAEETEETSEEKEEELQTIVIKELPTQEVTTGFIGEEKVNLITIEDALTEILKNSRLTTKAVA